MSNPKFLSFNHVRLQRAYPTMVSVQMLAELEEVIEYKLLPERQPVIREMWWQRLQVSRSLPQTY